MPSYILCDPRRRVLCSISSSSAPRSAARAPCAGVRGGGHSGCWGDLLPWGSGRALRAARLCPTLRASGPGASSARLVFPAGGPPWERGGRLPLASRGPALPRRLPRGSGGPERGGLPLAAQHGRRPSLGDGRVQRLRGLLPRASGPVPVAEALALRLAARRGACSAWAGQPRGARADLRGPASSSVARAGPGPARGVGVFVGAH